MSKRILFEELVARREQREADKLKIGELRIPDSDRTLHRGEKTFHPDEQVFRTL